MNSTKSLLGNRYDPVTIGTQLETRDSKPIGTIGNKDSLAFKKRVATADDALEQTKDLRAEVDTRTGNPMIGWYALQVARLGVSRYLGIAAEVRETIRLKGGSAPKLFNYLLKRA